jgi:hypothetical protein
MLERMVRAAFRNLYVFWSIVRLIAVDVMNLLAIP